MELIGDNGTHTIDVTQLPARGSESGAPVGSVPALQVSLAEGDAHAQVELLWVSAVNSGDVRCMYITYIHTIVSRSSRQ